MRTGKWIGLLFKKTTGKLHKMKPALDVKLRKTTIDDYPHLKNWFENPENNVFFTSEFRGLKSYEKIFLQMALSKKQNQYFMIVNHDQPIGFIGLINIDYQDKIGQTWYLLGDKTFAGQGVVSMALELLLIEAKKIGLHNVHTWVVENNPGSIKILKKNAFRTVGIQKEAYFYEGQFLDRVLFEKILD